MLLLARIQGLRLGDEAIDLELHRTEEDTGVLVKRRCPTGRTAKRKAEIRLTDFTPPEK